MKATLRQAIFALGPQIRYVASGEGQRVETGQRDGIADASDASSDFFEELLVNPTLLTLATRRGNIGAELAAIIPSAGVAIVAPAFPDTGRTTRNGRVYVRNVPLEQTETWRHEGLTGVADIATMLEQSGVRPASS